MFMVETASSEVRGLTLCEHVTKDVNVHLRFLFSDLRIFLVVWLGTLNHLNVYLFSAILPITCNYL